MKKYFVLFSATIALGAASCNEDAGNNASEKKDSTQISTDLVTNPRSAEGVNPADLEKMATMDFTDSVYDFGKIKEGEVVMHEFEFTNNGKSALIIASANASCGCTVPEYPKDPVAPGQTGKMTVRFNSQGKTGQQEKHITIKSNSRRGEQYLVIKAEVAEAKK
ncbi:MAG: DUF1573 domain-containing protein [Flavipsychrobacter sp.]|nr:DUF1573 domain-containing protein [Flavipsychrobacter sp.]